MDLDRMLKWVLGLGAVVYLAKIVSPQPPSPGKGRINISSVPSGASTYINDNLVGTTPTSTEVNPGSHLILLRKSGYNDWSTTKSILDGETIDITATLTPVGQPPQEKGLFYITSQPSGASTYIDGNFAGQTYISVEVSVGSHSILLKKSGYEDWSTIKSVSAGETVGISATLTPISQPPSGKGNLEGIVKDKSTSVPIDGAKVYITGGEAGSITLYTDSYGKYSVKDIAIGSYSIKASASGYLPETKSRTIFDGKTTTCDFLLEPETIATGSFRIKVYDASTNQQLGNVVIRVEEPMHEIEVEKRTSTSGWTWFYDLPAAELYSVTANYPNYRTWRDQFVVYPNMTTSREVYLQPS